MSCDYPKHISVIRWYDHLRVTVLKRHMLRRHYPGVADVRLGFARMPRTTAPQP